MAIFHPKLIDELHETASPHIMRVSEGESIAPFAPPLPCEGWAAIFSKRRCQQEEPLLERLAFDTGVSLNDILKADREQKAREDELAEAYAGKADEGDNPQEDALPPYPEAEDIVVLSIWAR